MKLKQYLQADPGWPIDWQVMSAQYQLPYVGPQAINPLSGSVQVTSLAQSDVNDSMHFFMGGDIVCARRVADLAHGVIGQVNCSTVRYGICAADYFVLTQKKYDLQMRFIMHWLRYVVRREVAALLLNQPDKTGIDSLPYVREGFIVPELLLQCEFRAYPHQPTQAAQNKLTDALDSGINGLLKKFPQLNGCVKQQAACAQQIAELEQSVWQSSALYNEAQSQLQ